MFSKTVFKHFRWRNTLLFECQLICYFFGDSVGTRNQPQVKFKCIVLRVWVCIRKWEGMGMSMGGHRNWQLSRCGENRDAQKRLATKNTVTSWTTDKHFFLWRRDGQPTFTFQHLSSNWALIQVLELQGPLIITLIPNHQAHNRLPVQPLLNLKETKLSLF